MGIRKRRSDRPGREVIRSPGRPPVARREDRRRFWAVIAAGQSSEDAAVGAGVSPTVGVRWFRVAGGMPPSTLAPSSKPPSGRYLSLAEREELAILRTQGRGVRKVARHLGRAAATISRELRRNAATRSGGLEYRATTAQRHAERAARRPKRAKLATNAALRSYVQERLAGVVTAPGGAGGALKGPPAWASAGAAVGQGVKNGPALAGHGAEAVRDAIAREIATLPAQLRQSLTRDQGAEMSRHARLRIDTGLPIYFCDPHSSWQRGTNKNTNGLLRQYFPKGTDLSAHSANDLAAVATALNTRPHETLGWKTSAETLDQFLQSAQTGRVATAG